MNGFLLGFIFAAIIAFINNRMYKKSLTLTANSHQREKILGKWYKISPETEIDDSKTHWVSCEILKTIGYHDIHEVGDIIQVDSEDLYEMVDKGYIRIVGTED